MILRNILVIIGGVVFILLFDLILVSIIEEKYISKKNKGALWESEKKDKEKKDIYTEDIAHKVEETKKELKEFVEEVRRNI